VALSQRSGVGQEAVLAFRGDELDRATGPRRKTDAQDRADVGLGDAGENAFGQAARRLDRLAVEEAPLQLVDVRKSRRFSTSAISAIATVHAYQGVSPIRS